MNAPNEMRPSWDQIWMQVASILALRSVDPRTQVGCLIVSDDNTRVLAVGYNGDQKGGPNRVESLEPGKSELVHAEENALIKADYNFPRRKVMYVTSAPCKMCAKKIINGEISEVVFRDEYRDMSGVELLRSAGVPVRQFKV